MDEPKPGKAILLAWLAACLLFSSGLAEEPGYIALASMLALIAGIGAFAYGFEWLVNLVLNIHWRYRDNQSITPFVRACHAASRLTVEQLAIVPKLEYQVEVGMVEAGAGEMTFYLLSPMGNIPLAFIRTFLKQSGIAYLQPVGDYPDKTPSRKYAQAFTNWLIVKGFALESVGPHSGEWMSPDKRAYVFRLFEVDDRE